MPDDDALLAAVAAAPDDDLPRLVYADWLDEAGQPDRAEFVRAQVRLAATDPWEPFAVFCRHRRPDWSRGDRWWEALPRVDGHALEWHPDRAFRRGFGHALIVRDVRWLLEEAPRLFARAPVGELHLPTATRDEWIAFARADWLPRVKSVHFYGTTTPVEPVRELCASPRAAGIEEIVFEKCSGAGMPVLLEDLLAAPLGRQLKRLDLRIGPDDSDPIYAALSEASGLPRLKSLSLTTFSTPNDGLTRLYASELVGGLTGLELANIDGGGPPWVDTSLAFPNLTRFRANRSGGISFHGAGHAQEPLRSLDLDGTPLDSFTMRVMGRQFLSGMPGLCALRLRNTQVSNLSPWVTAAYSPKLVELDLRDNRLTNDGAKQLMSAPAPPNLIAVLLEGNPLGNSPLGSRMRRRLRDHFGDALIL